MGRNNLALNHPWSSKVNHIFIIAALWPTLNLSLGKWKPSNEKVQEIKSGTCARHCYDALFTGGQGRNMGLAIPSVFYRLPLSKFLL